MKKKFSFILSCLLMTTVSSCSEHNSSITNSLQKSGDTKELSFGVKGAKKIENSSITFTGNWETLTDASASGGSYSSGINAFDNNNSVFKYVGNWLQNQTGNSAPTYALGGSNAFGYSTPVIVENNSTSSNLTYTGSGWNHNGVLGSSGFSFNYIYPYNTTIPYDSSGITYNGTWTTVSDSYKTNDGTQSGYVNLYFYGTNIEFVGYKGPDRGKVNITLYDSSTGAVVKTLNDIDLYDATEQVSSIGSFSALPYKTYNVRMTASGSKNSSSTGYRYDVIKGLFYPSVEYKFTGSHLRYQTLKYDRGGKVNVTIDGDTSNTSQVDLYAEATTENPWGYMSVVKEIWGLSSGEHRVTVESTPFSSAPDGYNVITNDLFYSFPGVGGTFSGTSADFYILKHPAYGIMNLWIDGQLNQEVDLYAATSLFQTVSVSGLTDTTHDFSFQGRGDKNSSASNNYFNFDGLITGSLPKASYTRLGTGMNYVATKGPDQGNVEVFYDNVSQGVFDLYSATPQYQQTIFSINNTAYNAPNISHTIEIRAKNTKNALSTGYGINVDAFILNYSTSFSGNM